MNLVNPYCYVNPYVMWNLGSVSNIFPLGGADAWHSLSILYLCSLHLGTSKANFWLVECVHGSLAVQSLCQYWWS